MMDNNKRHGNDDESNRKRIETVDELIEHILEMFEDGIDGNPEKTIIQGFTIINQPGKKPAIFGFSQEDPESSHYYEDDDNIYISQAEPFIEVQQTGDRIYVIADLSVDESCIEFHPSSTHVDITVIEDGMGYSEYVELPAEVDPGTLVSIYKNGVLELIFEYPENSDSDSSLP
ncbi:hypothetical protein V7O66_02645 [Methanolobus sp. ZRKC3]|uniref:Hsp20/alpha crystallin family protein n=1 Tax=Methanolobus sp. ZRKC3 TaxID=3125786 RepID=UPI0032551E9F